MAGRAASSKCRREGEESGAFKSPSATHLPDRQYQLETMVAEADMVACRVTVTGTFGTMPQLPVDGTSLITRPPTGKPYDVQHIHIFRIASGQIAEHWAARDDLGLLVQLGTLTVPAPARGGQDR